MIEEIYKYICEWANNMGNRAKMLVNFVVSNNWQLTELQLIQIFEYFLNEKWITNNEITNIELNTKILWNWNEIELQKLAHIEWVNRLDKNQELLFSKNLTVVYGKNASWKTWYSRILKSLWNSYDSENLILWDVLGAETISQSCEITFINKNTKKKETIIWKWDWTEHLPVSIFNGSCVNIWINNRKLTFSPYWFHLFDAITNWLENLSKLLDNKILWVEKDIETILILKNNIKSEKFVSFINNISGTTEKSVLENFVAQDEKDLEKNKEALIEKRKTCNTKLLKMENEIIDNKLIELKKIENIIDTYKKTFSEKLWKQYLEYKKELRILCDKPRLTISEIAKSKWLSFFNSSEFIDFIEKADFYFTKIEEENKSICPYCLQELNYDAINLLKSYNSVIHSNVQEKINKLTFDTANYENKIEQLEDSIIIYYNTFWKDENWNSILPKQIKKILSLKSQYKNNLENIDYANESLFKTCELLIKNTRKKLLSSKEGNQIEKIEEKEQKINQKILEVDDAITYLWEIDSLKKYISLMQLKDKLSALKLEFHWNKFSWIVQKAKDKLITDKFDEIFKVERVFLKCPEYIDYKLKVQNWKAKIDQSIRSNKLENILSEWEQKSIALAEFLTELQITGNKNPVIFDDPVNSLDDERLRIVAQRLFNFSNERQVIVFTHNVFLFNTFEQLYDWNTDQNQIYEYFPYYIEKRDGKTWFLYKNIPMIDMTYKKYLKKINELLNNSPKDKSNDEITVEWYNYLRALIELLIEEKIFCWTVKRLYPDIKTTKLWNVNWDWITKYKDRIMEIYNKSCRFNKWHSNQPWSVSIPEIKEFIDDFAEIKKIWDYFNC